MLRTAAPSMERPDGIRVGDLVDILDKMLLYPTNIDTLHYPYHAFHMWFGICDSAEIDEEFLRWQALERAARRE